MKKTDFRSTLTLTLPSVTASPTDTFSPLRAGFMGFPASTFTVDLDLVNRLLDVARQQRALAYAPFSHFHVGAAVVMADDPRQQLFVGANVENSSFGGTVCAERTAIFAATTQGFRRLRYLAVTSQNRHAPLHERSPCGLCRQVIREFADADTLIFIDAEPDYWADVFDIQRLLPFGFCFAGDR